MLSGVLIRNNFRINGPKITQLILQLLQIKPSLKESPNSAVISIATGAVIDLGMIERIRILSMSNIFANMKPLTIPLINPVIVPTKIGHTDFFKVYL
ncbi:hypothetical protein BC359_20250 (plasmid) [Priestia flexa]|nr:hypothetical protein BC359_20250 [Priestia flexa]